MGATHLNISAMLGAFYIGKNATSYFRTYMASEKMCRSIRGHAFFGAWLRLRTFLLPAKGCAILPLMKKQIREIYEAHCEKV